MSETLVSFKGYLRDLRVCEENNRDLQEVRRFNLDKTACYSYQQLKDKIKVVFPTINNKLFRVAWLDGEGDSVHITNDEELRIALNDTKDNLCRINILMNEEGEEGVYCHGCHVLILDNRYECLVCPDFDLCGECETANFHPDHNMKLVPDHNMRLVNGDRNNHGIRLVHGVKPSHNMNEKRTDYSKLQRVLPGPPSGTSVDTKPPSGPPKWVRFGPPPLPYRQQYHLPKSPENSPRHIFPQPYPSHMGLHIGPLSPTPVELGPFQHVPLSPMGPYPLHMGPYPPHMGPNPPHMGPFPPHMGPNPSHMEPCPPQMVPNPPHMGPNPPHMGPNSPHMGPNPPHIGSCMPSMGPYPPPPMPSYPPQMAPFPVHLDPFLPRMGPYSPPIGPPQLRLVSQNLGPFYPIRAPVPFYAGPIPSYTGPIRPRLGPFPPPIGPSPPFMRYIPPQIGPVHARTGPTPTKLGPKTTQMGPNPLHMRPTPPSSPVSSPTRSSTPLDMQPPSPTEAAADVAFFANKSPAKTGACKSSKGLDIFGMDPFGDICDPLMSSLDEDDDIVVLSPEKMSSSSEDEGWTLLKHDKLPSDTNILFPELTEVSSAVVHTPTETAVAASVNSGEQGAVSDVNILRQSGNRETRLQIENEVDTLENVKNKMEDTLESAQNKMACLDNKMDNLDSVKISEGVYSCLKSYFV